MSTGGEVVVECEGVPVVTVGGCEGVPAVRVEGYEGVPLVTVEGCEGVPLVTVGGCEGVPLVTVGGCESVSREGCRGNMEKILPTCSGLGTSSLICFSTSANDIGWVGGVLLVPEWAEFPLAPPTTGRGTGRDCEKRVCR